MRAHLGIDLIPPDDDPHVYVAKKGVIVTNSPARKSGWGNYVVVRHAGRLDPVSVVGELEECRNTAAR